MRPGLVKSAAAAVAATMVLRPGQLHKIRQSLGRKITVEFIIVRDEKSRLEVRLRSGQALGLIQDL